MFFELNEYVFGAGLFVNALLFLPQVFSLLKYKDSKEVSLLTFGGFAVLQVSTILHGIYKNDYLLIVGFSVSLFTCGWLTYLIIYYRLKARSAAKISGEAA